MALLVCAQPAYAVCMNNAIAWPGGYGIRDNGIYVPFYQANNPPRYCWNVQVRYQNYGAWTDILGCENMTDNQITFGWETIYARGSSLSKHADTGYFRVRARAHVPACGYRSNYSVWKSLTFDVPSASSDTAN